MDNYISRLDEIDRWLFDSFGILPGACSSTENLRHTTARMVAEALWPKKDLALTPDDVKLIIKIHYEIVFKDTTGVKVGDIPSEVLRRFNEHREKK